MDFSLRDFQPGLPSSTGLPYPDSFNRESSNGQYPARKKNVSRFCVICERSSPPASRLNLNAPGDSATDPEEQAMMLGINAAAVVEEALTYFSCRDEWYMIAGSVCRRKRLKEKLNGKLVEQTTGFKGIATRDIIAAMKQMASEDELISMELEEVRGLIRRRWLMWVALLYPRMTLNAET